MKAEQTDFLSFIDIFDMKENEFHIEGWAAFVYEETYTAPEQFILQVNDRVLAITPPNFPRSDVSNFLKSSTTSFGFKICCSTLNKEQNIINGDIISISCTLNGIQKSIFKKTIDDSHIKETFTISSFTKKDMPTNSVECHSNIENIKEDSTHIYVSGWACLSSPNNDIEKIAVIDTQKMIGIGYALIPISRMDVQKIFPEAQTNSGFSFKIPKKIFAGDPFNDLMFYGIVNGGIAYTKICGIRNMLCLEPFFEAKNKRFLSIEKLQFIDITLTHRCNLSCKYCCMRGKHHMETKIADAKKIDVKSILKVMRSTQVKVNEWQMSSIGEMSMHPQWTEIADRISEESNLAILSNFSKPMNTHEINTLAKSKKIIVSIDTANPKDHSKIREGSNLARIVSNLVRIKNIAREQQRAIPQITIATVVSKPCIPFLPALAVLAVSLEAVGMLIQDISIEEAVAQDIDGIDFSIDTMDSTEKDNLYSSISTMLKILDKNGISYDLYGALRNFISTENNHTTASSKQTKKCLMPWKQMMLGIDMNMNPCGYIDCVGICTDQTDINHIINGKRMQAIRYGLLTGNLEPCCTSCRYGLMCSLEELEDAVTEWIN